VAGEQEKVEDEPGRLFLSASYFVLFVGGMMLGLFGTLLLPYSVASPFSAPAPASGPGGAAHVLAAGSGGSIAQVLSVGLLIALLANPMLGLAGIWMAGTRLAAFTPFVGWLVVVLAFTAVTTDGNNVLPSSARSASFLLVGAATFIAVGMLVRPTRGMFAQNRQRLLASGPVRPGHPKSGVARPITPKSDSAGSTGKSALSKSPPRKSSGGRTAPKGGRRR
jgi:hypothetical protein